MARLSACALLLGATLLGGLSLSARAQTDLADQPPFSQLVTPGNLLLTPSVEWPTINSVAHVNNIYSPNQVYLGYFDPHKCYQYVSNVSEPERHFAPVSVTDTRTCNGQWSGNFLNWAATQTIDAFRHALTGGLRVRDTETETWLEKARHDGQGGTLFPNRRLPNSGDSSVIVSGATPFNVNWMRMRVESLGNRMRFRLANDDVNLNVTVYDGGAALTDRAYEVSVRVKVCDGDVGLEPNCVVYPSGYAKPEGTLQQYSDRIRYGVFGYLNDHSMLRDGAALRARQKYIGPEIVIPGELPEANPRREWDPQTGVLVRNPNPQDATDTTAVVGQAINDSGVINYLNKFGQMTTRNHKNHDPVSELYYAGLRYFRNLGNVPEYTNLSGTNAQRFELADGFPVITTWDDPIAYSCQRNVILGIGDIYTHRDKNLPGNSRTVDEPAVPGLVAGDTGLDVALWTQRVATLEGITINTPFTGRENSAYMAGMAYYANTTDLRTEESMPGRQSVSTYWVDVLEAQSLEGMARNQFALTAKYGGFRVPTNYNPATRTEPLEQEWWHTNGTTLTPFGSRGNGQPAFLKPDNFFTAGNANAMVESLTQAFSQIAAELRAYTTSFSLPQAQVALAGNISYSAQYDAENWTGELTASELTFDENTGEPSLTTLWNATDLLDVQLGGTGWDADRRVVTWNPESEVGIPFRHANLTAAQQALLNTPYRAVDDGADYVNYLRGDRTHERGSTAAGSSLAYRQRAELLGDVVGSKVRPIGPPQMPLAEAANPGYLNFKETWAARPMMVYLGANDGMLHAFNGATTGSDAGREVFAYVPSMVIGGPSGTPEVDGLAALGNPSYEHRYFVDATPIIVDVDMGNTVGGSGTPTWRSLLVGGLGKGGRGYYAIDVTNPAAMTTEAAVASRVLWEFTDEDMGFSFADPIIVKTRKHGWVVILTSGYNNLDGRGYMYVVNARTGDLLEKVVTPTGYGTAANPLGMTHGTATYPDVTDRTADAFYVGDLQGNVWRFDLTPAQDETYLAPIRFAELRSPGGDLQPVTTKPWAVMGRREGVNRRYILVGTGRLLAESDMNSTQIQTFYAFQDGSAYRFNTADDLPTGVTFPLQRTNLTPNTDLVAGLTEFPATGMGWYADLGQGDGNIGWRMIIDADDLPGAGWILFSTMLPNGDPCSPSGISRIYAVNVATGRSVARVDGAPVPYVSRDGLVTDVRLLVVNGEAQGVAGTRTGGIETIETEELLPTGIRRINWRELPIAN